MLHKNRVFDQLLNWHGEGIGMVLATVIATEGSTYSKTGDFILINQRGDYQGLVSGGCVEGDLAARSASALADGLATTLDYDLGGEHDAVWGMGAGCDGRLQILLTPLLDAAGYAPLLAVADAYRAGASAVLALSLGPRPIMSSASAEGHFVHAGVDEAWRSDLEQQLGEQWLARQSASQRLASADADLFMIYVNPAPRVLVCGAAPDVEPLCALLLDLGWHVHVYDHRPAYIERLTDTLSHPRLTQSCDRPQALAREVPLRLYGAAIVMSHHLDSDEAYLSALATSSHWQYVGLLGPTQRRERLLEALGERADGLRGVLDGPAGIPIGGREPASIALSIAAGVHARLAACAAL